MLFQLLVQQVLAGPNLAAFGDRNRVAGFMDHTEKDYERLD